MNLKLAKNLRLSQSATGADEIRGMTSVAF
jgi:hypothetical protein